MAAQIKRKKLMLRGTAGAIVVATLLAASALGATAIRGRNAAKRAESAATSKQTENAPSSTAAAPVANPSPAQPATTTTAVASVAPAAPFSPVLAPGNSPLPNGVNAFRADSEVTVSFDVPMERTRIPEKFERFVRATLPAVYGSGIDSVLSKVAVGALVSQGNLLTELPSAGVRIPVSAAWELRVFPETRKGQDGPLVVRYRSVMCEARDARCGAR